MGGLWAGLRVRWRMERRSRFGVTLRDYNGGKGGGNVCRLRWRFIHEGFPCQNLSLVVIQHEE